MTCQDWKEWFESHRVAIATFFVSLFVFLCIFNSAFTPGELTEAEYEANVKDHISKQPLASDLQKAFDTHKTKVEKDLEATGKSIERYCTVDANGMPVEKDAGWGAIPRAFSNPESTWLEGRSCQKLVDDETDLIKDKESLDYYAKENNPGGYFSGLTGFNPSHPGWTSYLDSKFGYWDYFTNPLSNRGVILGDQKFRQAQQAKRAENNAAWAPTIWAWICTLGCASAATYMANWLSGAAESTPSKEDSGEKNQGTTQFQPLPQQEPESDTTEEMGVLSWILIMLLVLAVFGGAAAVVYIYFFKDKPYEDWDVEDLENPPARRRSSRKSARGSVEVPGVSITPTENLESPSPARRRSSRKSVSVEEDMSISLYDLQGNPLDELDDTPPRRKRRRRRRKTERSRKSASPELHVPGVRLEVVDNPLDRALIPPARKRSRRKKHRRTGIQAAGLVDILGKKDSDYLPDVFLDMT